VNLQANEMAVAVIVVAATHKQRHQQPKRRQQRHAGVLHIPMQRATIIFLGTKINPHKFYIYQDIMY